MITTICFQLSSNLDAAAELNWASSSSSTSFQVGCKYDVDKDASFRVGKLLYYCAMWQHCYQESCLKYTYSSDYENPLKQYHCSFTWRYIVITLKVTSHLQRLKRLIFLLFDLLNSNIQPNVSIKKFLKPLKAPQCVEKCIFK